MSKINLLPSSFKEGHEYSKRNRKILSILYTYVALSVAVYVGMGVVWAYLFFANQITQRDINEKQKTVASYAQLEQNATALASRLDVINRILTAKPSFRKPLEEISYRRPNGVTVARIAIDVKPENRATVEGLAVNLQTLGLFRNALEESELFDYVDIASVSPDSGQYRFNLTLTLASGALR